MKTIKKKLALMVHNLKKNIFIENVIESVGD